MRSLTQAIVFLATIACLARAATITLDTNALASSMTWTDGGIWVGGVAPTSTDDVVIGSCGTSSPCSSGSQAYMLSLPTDLRVASLTIAHSDIVLFDTNALTVTNGLKWYAGYINVPVVSIAGTSIISAGEAGAKSEYATQTLLAATELTNTGTLTISTLNFKMPDDSKLINADGATLNLVPTTNGVATGLSATNKYWGSSWNNNYDVRPVKFPIIDNRGIMSVQGGSRASPVDSIWIVADFKSSGSVTVGAGNVLNFWRPFASTTSSVDAPTITDTWAGSWTFNGPMQVIGGAIELAADFVSSGNGFLTLGDLGDCGWFGSSSMPDGMSLFIRGNAALTLGNRFTFVGCSYVAGTNKLTFSNQVTVNDVIFRAPVEFLSNFTINERGDSNKDAIRIESTVTLSGYSIFQRGASMYDDYIIKMGPASSLVVAANAELLVKWAEFTWVDAANKGSAVIDIQGKATFVKGPYTYDWYVNTNLAASSSVYFSGPATTFWLPNSDVVNFRTTGTAAGLISVKNFYGPVFAGTWSFASTASVEGATSGKVSWAVYFSFLDVPSGLSITTNGQTIDSLWLSGNDAKLTGPANKGTLNFRNHYVTCNSLYRPAGTTFVFKNYTVVDWYTITLEGATFINEGNFMLGGSIQENQNLNTRGRVINNGNMTLNSEGNTGTHIQLINTGAITIRNPQTAGIISSGTIEFEYGTAIMEDTLILSPTSAVTFHVTGPTANSKFQFNGGFWCHVQGAARFVFDTTTNPWSPSVGQSWEIATTSASQECIGKFSSVEAVGLEAGLGVKVTWSKDYSFYGIQLSICALTDATCNTAAEQTTTKLVYSTQFAAKYLPAGIYTPPTGTVTDTTAPVADPVEAAAASVGVVVSFLVAIVFSAIALM